MPVGVGADRARQRQQRRPDPLRDECRGRDMLRVGARDRAEKEPVARHRVIDPRAGEDEPVIAAKSRDHDGGRHRARSRLAQDRSHRRHRDPILRGVRDFA